MHAEVPNSEAKGLFRDHAALVPHNEQHGDGEAVRHDHQKHVPDGEQGIVRWRHYGKQRK